MFHLQAAYRLPPEDLEDPEEEDLLTPPLEDDREGEDDMLLLDLLGVEDRILLLDLVGVDVRTLLLLDLVGVDVR
jgi:hypothetical protein